MGLHRVDRRHLDDEAFEWLGRYEAPLWRQMVQTLFALQLSGIDKQLVGAAYCRRSCARPYRRFSRSILGSHVGFHMAASHARACPLSRVDLSGTISAVQ